MQFKYSVFECPVPRLCLCLSYRVSTLISCILKTVIITKYES